MAKPDCDDGYYKLSYELGAALLTFGFGEIEGFILGRVLEQQYGWAKKKMVHIRTCEIATLLDVDRRLVNRALHKLVGVGVLMGLGDDCYTFVKDYESWETPHWRQAKRDRWTLFAKRAPDRAKADRPKAPPRDRDDLIGYSDGPSDDVISKDDKTDESTDAVSSSKMTDCHLQSRQLVISKDDNAGVPPGPPIEEARAECKKGRSEEELYVCVNARESEPDKDLVAYIHGKLMEANGDGVFAADFAARYASDWMREAKGDETLVRQAVFKLATARISPWGVGKWMASYLHNQAQRPAATIPIGSPRPQAAPPARLSPAQQRMQDQWDAFKELERKAKEGA